MDATEPRYSAETIAKALYLGILDRPAEQSALDHTIKGLLACGAAPSDVASHIHRCLSSKEYLDKSTAKSNARASRALLANPLVSGDEPIRHITSLGSHCMVSYAIKDLGLKRYSCPFDWIFSNIGMVKHCLTDSFVTLIDRTYYTQITDKDGKEADNRCDHAFYRDEFGVHSLFNHRNMRKPENYVYLLKCVRRFLALLRNPDRKLFVLVAEARPDLDVASFKSLHECLALATSNFDLLVIRVMAPKRDRTDFGLTYVSTIGQSRLLDMRPTSKMGPHNFEETFDNLILQRAILSYGLDQSKLRSLSDLENGGRSA